MYKLDNLYKQGVQNQVTLRSLSREKILDAQPGLVVAGGIYSPNTGIIDVPELITALEGDIQHHEGVISFKTSFVSAKKLKNSFEISCKDKGLFSIEAKTLINSSGLNSFEVSKKIFALDQKYNSPIYFAKGHYFKYSGANPFSSLIYPLADEFSLGIHVGFDISGQLRFGPDLTWVDALDYSFDESLKEKFINSILSYWPAMDPAKLHPDYVGIRPKIQKPSDAMKDFSILGPSDHGVDGLINLQGIESPGVTSSLAIGKYVSSFLSSH